MNLKKNLILLFCICSLSSGIFSQSISIDAGYPYFMQLNKSSDFKNMKNRFNYVVGIRAGLYFKSSKLEMGVASGTKNYIINIKDESYYIQTTKVNLNYFYVPVIFHQRLFTDSVNTVSVFLGITFMLPFKYSKESVLRDSGSIVKENIPTSKLVGNSIRLGFRYSRSISREILFFTEVYGDYKFKMDYIAAPRSNANMTDDRFSMAIGIGLEWIFSKQALSYYKKKNR